LLNFKLFFAVIIVFFLSSCGYHDNLHVRHHQLLLLWNNQYQALETSLNEQYALYKKGKLTGSEFSRQIFSLEYANEGAESRFVGYEQAIPDSQWSHLLHGLYLVRLADDARGDEVVSKTPQANFDKMHDLAEHAKILLETAHEYKAPFSLYAGGMIKVNRMLGIREENESLAKEAVARDHDVWRAANAYFLTLYPQWGGSEEAMAAFVAQVRPANPKLAKALEAKIYLRRGVAYKGSHDIDAAISQYKQAIDIYPDENALKDLGEIYLQTNQCVLAVAVLERNLEENDEWDLWTLESLAQAHKCAGNSWRAKLVDVKRSELFTRYSKGE